MWLSLRSTVLWLTGEIVQCLKSMEGFPKEKAELCLERQISWRWEKQQQSGTGREGTQE